jgi:exodeoxyribonuclease V gamma subunit
VLVGVAMAEEGRRMLAGVLPLDDVGSSDIDLAGRFAELLGRLRAAVDSFAGPMPLDGWAAAIAGAADSLTESRGRSAWERVQLGHLLDDVVGEGTTAGAVTPTPLTLGEIRALLADRLRGRPTRASFRTGHLTICTLVPMRSVPHRVVCLLGLDDGVFPRQTARDGDDLLLLDPHVGDRDARSEDRQLLLDALLAATDRLVITYAARDERTNLRRPPAVPLGELLDVVDATVRAADAAAARERIVVEHPLQPFDPRNFQAGALGSPQAWSFDRVALEGARALTGDRPAPPPFLAGPLPPAAERVVELDRLVEFVQHPVRAFLRQRLGAGGAAADDDVDDAFPIALGGLGEWRVGERLLEGLLDGDGVDACIAAEIARGELPPELLADAVLARVVPVAERLAEVAAAHLPAGDAASVEVGVELPGGRRLVGTVPGLRGDVVANVTYSRVSARRRLAAWARLLALAATGREVEAITIGRRRSGGAGVTIARAGGVDDPAAALASLVDLHDQGLREPLPLFCETSAAWVAGGRGAALEQWESARYPGEDADPEHRLVLGGVRPLDDLLAEGSRAAVLARRLWDPLLAHEELSDA